MRTINLLLFCALFLCSCGESEEKKISRLLNEWKGQEIAFPANILCVSDEDTLDYKIPHSDLTLFAYIDSLGCRSFRERISKWKEFIAKVDTLTDRKVGFLFFFAPTDINEMRYILHKEKFTYPVYFDVEDKINKLNKFSGDIKFQTFLLDEERQVIMVGNPAISEEVEATYERIIKECGLKKEAALPVTEVSYGSDVINLGDFDWQSPYETTILLKNTGEEELVVKEVVTSSESLYVEYSRDPVSPNKEWELYIRCKAPSPGIYDGDITIQCNVPDSSLHFSVKGNAK